MITPYQCLCFLEPAHFLTTRKYRTRQNSTFSKVEKHHGISLLSIRARRSLLLSPHAQKLLVLRRAPLAPGFTPDPHRNGRGHAHHDHDGVESEDGPVAGGIDEVLQRLGNGEIDARRADGEDDDDLAGNLLQSGWWLDTLQEQRQRGSEVV